jgi:hypothetical protein
MIKAIEQVAIRNIEIEKTAGGPSMTGFILKAIKRLQRGYARLKFAVLHEFENHKLNEELLL